MRNGGIFTSSRIEEIDHFFWAGNVSALKGQFCPSCNSRLLYSIYRGPLIPGRPPGGRHKCGISIYCLGKCSMMLSHSDGYLPIWAEAIEDWDQFNNELYDLETRTRYPLPQRQSAVITKETKEATRPFCGGKLRTATAKQCRYCLRDWHDPHETTFQSD